MLFHLYKYYLQRVFVFERVFPSLSPRIFSFSVYFFFLPRIFPHHTAYIFYSLFPRVFIFCSPAYFITDAYFLKVSPYGV